MAELIASVAGVILSLLFSYVPGLSDRFNALPGDKKRLTMLGLLALVALGMFGASCVGLPELAGGAACTRDGALEVGRAFFAALVANQAAYLLSPRKQTGPYFPVGRKPADGEDYSLPYA